MKKLAIMQPYFLPYIGYWQLMDAVDTFVIYDDGAYIKNGWIHKNRILCNGYTDTQFIHLSVSQRSVHKKINEITVSWDERRLRNLLKGIEMSYHKAPYFLSAYPVIRSVFENPETNLARYLTFEIQTIAEYMGIQTQFLLSSAIDKSGCGDVKEKIYRVCETVGIFDYINPIGGQRYYDKEEFARHGVKLSFIQRGDVRYRQFSDTFIPDLSILDVLMFNSPAQIRELLKRYTLI